MKKRPDRKTLAASLAVLAAAALAASAGTHSSPSAGANAALAPAPLLVPDHPRTPGAS